MNLNITWEVSRNSSDATASAQSDNWEKTQQERRLAYELQFYAALFGREVSLAFGRYHKGMDTKYMSFQAARRKHRVNQRRTLRFKRKLRLLVSP